jgi:hypothetical protein
MAYLTRTYFVPQFLDYYKRVILRLLSSPKKNTMRNETNSYLELIAKTVTVRNERLKGKKRKVD